MWPQIIYKYTIDAISSYIAHSTERLFGFTAGQFAIKSNYNCKSSILSKPNSLYIYNWTYRTLSYISMGWLHCWSNITNVILEKQSWLNHFVAIQSCTWREENRVYVRVYLLIVSIFFFWFSIKDQWSLVHLIETFSREDMNRWSLIEKAQAYRQYPQ